MSHIPMRKYEFRQRVSARIVGALRLTPMSLSQLATCLSHSRELIRRTVYKLNRKGVVCIAQGQFEILCKLSRTAEVAGESRYDPVTT